jgi:hypothetical protein
VANPATNAIVVNSGGFISSESEFNMVAWNIGTNTGSYVLPFGYSSADYLPVTCDISTAGVGSGMIKFSTYHGSGWDNSTYEPSDVANMTDFSVPNYSSQAVDRFWIVDANTGYTTKPTPDLTFTYIRGASSPSEIATPNYIVESDLFAQRYNSSLNEWYDWTGASTGTDITSGNTGTVTTGNVPVADFYRSWCLFNDSTITTSVGTQNFVSSQCAVYPNPASNSFTVQFGDAQAKMVSLYNIPGQKLSETDVKGFKSQLISVSNLPSGIYFLQVLMQDGSKEVKKVEIQR